MLTSTLLLRIVHKLLVVCVTFSNYVQVCYFFLSLPHSLFLSQTNVSVSLPISLFQTFKFHKKAKISFFFLISITISSSLCLSLFHSLLWV